MNSTARPLLLGLLVLIVLTGIGFRFSNLDKKVLWMDETFTAHWLAGYSLPEIRAETTQKRLWTPAELMKFQTVTAGRGVDATRRALAIDDPKHPPLFYLALRLWCSIAGDSVFAIRLFPALLSLLMFPALWCLCRELFIDDPNRELIAPVALALLAISPYYVLYAQEAREYSLWAVVLAASSAVFLRALRTGSRKWWGVYALSLAAGIYTHTLTVLLWAVHAATVGAMWWRQRRADAPSGGRNPWLPFGLATLGAALLFLPWVLQILLRQESLSNNTAWLAGASSLGYLVQTWISLPGLIFFDPNQTQRWTLPGQTLAWAIPAVRVVRILLCALVLWALVFVWRKAPRRSALFIVLLAAVPFLAVAIPDVLLDGYRSTIARFAIPCFLSGQLAVAYLLATKLATPATRLRGAGILAMLLCTGLFSCALSAQADAWWNKSFSYHVPQTAHLINARKKPIVVLHSALNFLTLSRRLEPHVTLFLLEEEEVPDNKTLHFLLARETETVLFYTPSAALRKALQERGAILKPSPGSPELWELEKT